MNLHAGIVVIELAAHVPAARGEQTRDAIADRRVASVADVQRAGRIGRDEFHARHLAGAVLVVTVVAAIVEHARDLGVVRLRAQEEIDEARSGDFHFVDLCTFRQRGDQRFGDRARILARRFGQQHRGIGGEIAMFFLPRAFDHEGRGGIGGQGALFPQALDRAQDELIQSFFHEEILRTLRIVVSAVFNQKLQSEAAHVAKVSLRIREMEKPHQKADFPRLSSLWITLWVERLARSKRL